MASRTSVVIDDFHVVGVGFLPPEANPPLIVDSNAVLPCAIAPQGLQAIARWHSQISQPIGDLELAELPPCHFGDVHEAFDPLSTSERRRLGALEAPDHERRS